MDVTPQLIEQIDFSEKWKGYDPDEVDDFLERVGATLTGLLDQVRRLGERAEAAERAARDSTPASAPVGQDDPEIQEASRTLVLAKRTADAAVAEARAEASGLLSEAKAKSETDLAKSARESDRLVREALAKRDELLKKAEKDAEAEYADQRDDFRRQVEDLESQKLRLLEEVKVVEGRIADYRDDIAKVRDSMQELLDDPESLRAQPPLKVEVGDSTTDRPTSPFYSTSSTPIVRLPEAGDTEAPKPTKPSAPATTGSGSSGGGAAVVTTKKPAVVSTTANKATTPSGMQAGSAKQAPGKPVTERAGAEGGDPNDQAQMAKQIAEASAKVADPWGPGSWAEVAAETESSPAESTGSVAIEAPAEAEGDIDGPSDERIDAFLDADEPKPRRFGRRR